MAAEQKPTPTFKAGDAVKAKSPKSGKVSTGKFVKEHGAAKGVFWEIDLGELGSKKFRPSQVTAA